jgi:hypothetical protein
MIRQLRLADHRGRDATCGLLPVRLPDARRWQDLAGQPVQMLRRVRATAATHPDTLLAQSPDPDDLAQTLIAGDPEWDLRALGRPTGPCTRGYLDGDEQRCYAPQWQERRADSPDGESRLRPLPARPANLAPATPPVWSGVLLPRQEIVRRVAFVRAYQVVHGDTLQFDFLYDLVQYLQQRNAMVQVGSGRQGRGPLVCERNGRPYRGFLDGRVQGEAMRLVLYLAAGELTLPEEGTP